MKTKKISRAEKVTSMVELIDLAVRIQKSNPKRQINEAVFVRDG